ncbi:winged helix-turn-helix domain-containing protein, partial [bacterium]|nr:winged helix-turn-helix domain-containing protein [bacterium]
HITDSVEAYLKERSSKTPIHYRDLSDQIQSEGHFLPGKDPAANLLSQVNRDERFVRVSSGTYGLREWGLEPAKTKKSRRKKK